MIAIRFDGPPGPGDESGRFIEVERDGASIEFGTWVQDGDYWLLELTEVAQLEAELAKLNYIELPNEKVSNVFEAYIAWKNKAGKLEAELKDKTAKLKGALLLMGKEKNRADQLEAEVVQLETALELGRGVIEHLEQQIEKLERDLELIER